MRYFIAFSFFLIVLNAEVLAQPQLDFSIFQYRCVGPTRGGRVTAVAGIASQPSVFYMGSTGGGVWKTADYGMTWRNVSDGYFESPSIGAIRVAQNDPNIVYVGTGSDGLRSNVITGKGVYKSINGGNTWQHIGLKNTGQIGAIEIDPTNHNIVFVAAIGQAFQANKERGIFRTKDGGKTWKKVLYISDTTGFTDLEFMPSNSSIIYAAAWRAERKPWTIISGGKENGVYKSIDGGDTWKKIEKGLPTGIVGKIDLAVSPADSKVLFALVEAANGRSGLYRSDDQGESFIQVSNKFELLQRAFYYTNIDVDPTNTNIVYAPVQTNFKSSNGGKTWRFLRTPHGDNHDMWINPNDPNIYIQANDGGANVTVNGGKTWSTQLNQPTAELYQVEVDDQYPYWLYAGQQDNYTTIAVPSRPTFSHQAGGIGLVMNTGGCETGPAVPKPGNPDIVYANCKGRFSVFNKKTGQEKSYVVGAQYMYGHNPKDLMLRFQRVSPIHISPHNSNVIYHTSQFVHKTTDEGKTWTTISPDLTAFTPETQVISGSPITRDITGEEFYSTIYAIRESPIEKGLIWVGANDGPVHMTKNEGGADGKSWTDVTPKSLPKGGRVDCVEPSPHHAAKAYIAVLRYQLGDWHPYIYKTKNYGKKWTLITTGKNGIPADYPTRVVREDPDRPGLLYAGTEFGMFISLNDGKSWQPFQQNLPVTPITDIKVHRKDLVLSTMGRGFWILDNLSALHDTYEKTHATVRLFKPRTTYQYRYRPSLRSIPTYPRAAVMLDYFLPQTSKTPVRLEIKNASGQLVRAFSSSRTQSQNATSEKRDMATNFVVDTYHSQLKSSKGFHRFLWDFKHVGSWDKMPTRRYRNGPQVSPGVYTAHLIVDGQTYQQSFELLLDPKVKKSGVTIEDVKAQETLALKIVNLLSNAKKLAVDIERTIAGLQISKMTLTESQKQQQTDLKRLLKQLNRDKGHYTQPMLISQIEYLYGLTRRADQLLGKDIYTRYGVLEIAYKTLKKQYERTK